MEKKITDVFKLIEGLNPNETHLPLFNGNVDNIICILKRFLKLCLSIFRNLLKI